MGIPKLMTDLSPYTERAILGKQLELEVAVGISAVVIDGPSFVYDVFQRQMRSLSEVKVPLAYRNINKGLIEVLDEIRSRVDIKKIYFDGALPVSKRKTRLERLENHRRDLEHFIKSREVKGSSKDLRKQPAAIGTRLLKVLDSYQSHNLKALTPPFIVASAIEHLRLSEYASLVDVIPDEAEAGCIMYACRQQGVAMLSNDSDLVVYPEACTRNLTLVLLHTLERTELNTGEIVLMADCLRPSEISRRIQIPNLNILAFQRFVDPSASAAIIRRRAQGVTTMDSIFLKAPGFMAEYSSNIVSEVEKALPAQNTAVLDPRLCELRSQYRNSRHAVNKATALHMYLPALFEDPSRESPWTYGSDLRQLAYSLLSLLMHSKSQRAPLLEYQRRGHRITGVQIDLLSKKDLSEVFHEDVSSLQYVRLGDSTAETMISWQQLAVRAVYKRRQEDNRVTFLPAFHLSACCQAFLYSFRLLKQIIDFLVVTAPTSHLIPHDTLDKLATMPQLADLMDAIQEQYTAT